MTRAGLWTRTDLEAEGALADEKADPGGNAIRARSEGAIDSIAPGLDDSMPAGEPEARPPTALTAVASTERAPVSTIRRGIFGRIAPGQRLYGKYDVLRKLGSGAMGDVWLVRHAILKSEHALKVIVPNFATNTLALMRFQREFEVMATLRHEHAVTIYDAAIDDDGGYIDMEYIVGATLHEILSTARGRAGRDPSNPLMSLEWIVRVLDQLCEVLQAAHDKGIVHRDLKPSNMMLIGGRLVGKEYLKVLDFGIAKIRDDPEGAIGRDRESSDVKTLGFIGTPSYGSPEQATGSADLDGRSDLYSVGIMLYEFVAGRLPFRGNHWQVMSQNATVPPPPFAESAPRLRPMPELERTILRVLEKDPARRPRTARELADEIRRAVEAVGSAPWPARGADLDHLEPIETSQPTEREGFAGRLPLTEPATLRAEVAPGSSKRLALAPDRVGFDDPPPAALRLRRPRPKLSGIGAILAIGAAVVGLAWLGLFARPTPAPVGGGSTDRTPAKPEGFERYWPLEYRPVEGSARGTPWPEKARRTTDETVFVRFTEGIYLPEGFEVEGPDRVDGWPRVITREAMRFLRMPGGTWVMGAWDAPNAIDRPDAPAHPVRLSGFYLQEFEVTHAQVEAYLDRTQSARPPEWERAFNKLKRRAIRPEIAGRHPASNLSRKLALDFAAWAGGQLPTEAQWEYAARSLGKKRRYSWGETPPPGRTMANVDSLDMTTMPVGSFATDKTEQGVFDLVGNVQEMCRDAWVSSYSRSDEAVVDPCQPPGDPVKAEYAIRGGAYDSLPDHCPVTRRDDRLPAVEPDESLGFRLVVECPDTRRPR